MPACAARSTSSARSSSVTKTLMYSFRGRVPSSSFTSLPFVSRSCRSDSQVAQPRAFPLVPHRAFVVQSRQRRWASQSKMPLSRRRIRSGVGRVRACPYPYNTHLAVCLSATQRNLMLMAVSVTQVALIFLEFRSFFLSCLELH